MPPGARSDLLRVWRWVAGKQGLQLVRCLRRSVQDHRSGGDRDAVEMCIGVFDLPDRLAAKTYIFSSYMFLRRVCRRE